MSRKGGGPSPMATTASAALIYIAFCVGFATSTVSDGSQEGFLFLLKSSIRWLRHMLDKYHPEIELAKCTASTFSYLGLYRDTYAEFRQLHLDVPLLDSPPSFNLSPSSTTSSPITLSPPSSPFTSPLATSSPSPPLPSSPPSSSSLSLPPVSSTTPQSLPAFNLPSHILMEALSASGITQEDSLFVHDLMGFFLPSVFRRAAAERASEEEEGGLGGGEGENELEWLDGLRALLLSVSGVLPTEKSDTLWELVSVPSLQRGAAVSPENRRWTLIPMPWYSALREEEGGLLGNWWRSLRNTTVQWYSRLSSWLNPVGEEERVVGAGSSVVSMAYCLRSYMVDVVWRWAETGTKGLKKEEVSPKHVLGPDLRSDNHLRQLSFRTVAET